MIWRKWIRALVCLMLVGTCVSAYSVNGRTAAEELLENTSLVPGESTSDWTALAAARNGVFADRDAYLQGLWDYVSDSYQEQGGLDTIKATVWHRISLTVLALGADPTCFGEDAGGNPIDLIADGTYDWHMTGSLGIQGTNAWIYALLVLDSMDYQVPAGARYTREDMIAGILECQTEDGGFHIGSGVSDADVTAMALQALAPYYEENTAVTQSVDRALGYLSALQTARGDFGSSSESGSQVILALCALGIDPDTDERFCKAGGSAVNGLLLYHTEVGFSHLLGGEADSLATQQAAQALTAYDRLISGAGRLYDFTDQTIEPYTPASTLPLWLIAPAAIVALAVIIVLSRKGKKSCTE